MFSRDIEIFIGNFVDDITSGNAAIFAGAGLSIPVGFVSWKELVRDIAYELELDIDKEADLISIAQYHLNERKNRHRINQKIIEEFSNQAEETENHRIISRLPIQSIWTTNYDQIIEKTYSNIKKVCDVKINPKDLTTNIHKRDVVVYKMHGDYRSASDAILTKQQYERYFSTHAPFINALSGELTTKTFLFLGFSFEDPNLQYVLSRLYNQYGENSRTHYCIMRKVQFGDKGCEDQASFEYNSRKQKLMLNDLSRYGIQTLEISDYDDITKILKAIEIQYKKNTIFISGSAEDYSPYSRDEAIKFIHRISKKIIKKNYRIVNGFGWGIGTSIINGALEAIYESNGKISESQLILRPFPQFSTSNIPLADLWHQYRQKMISLSGISVFMFGNKLDKYNKLVNADGLLKEYEISNKNGNICIPIGCTGYISHEIYKKIKESGELNFFTKNDEAMRLLDTLNESGDLKNKEDSIIKLLELISKEKSHD